MKRGDPMDPLDGELVNTLRVMAGRGEPPSALLQRIVAHLQPRNSELSTRDRLLLVGYFTAAFCFRDGQGQPIFGWFPDGRGELKDADIDRIMSRRIHQTQLAWESPGQPRTGA
jgi:hypothetical protein